MDHPFQCCGVLPCQCQDGILVVDRAGIDQFLAADLEAFRAVVAIKPDGVADADDCLVPQGQQGEAALSLFGDGPRWPSAHHHHL